MPRSGGDFNDDGLRVLLVLGHRLKLRLAADADSRARLLEALASFVRAGSGSARRTLLGLDDLMR